MRIERTITVSKDEAKEIQDILDKPGTGGDEVIATFTADFGNGIEADIKVCDTSADSTPFIDPVIFDHGQEILCLDVGETLIGEYVFSVNPDEFVVIIQEG